MKFLVLILLSLVSQNIFSAEVADPFQPGWSGKYLHGLGFNTNSRLGFPTIIYDHYTNSNISYTFNFGFTKAASTASQTTTSTATTTTNAFGGAKSMSTFTLAASYNYRLYRSEWANVRVGFLGGVTKFFDTDYGVGTETTTIATGTTVRTGYGSTLLSRSTQVFMGPMFYQAFDMRWFPNITIGMDMGILYFFSSQQTATTNSETAGVASTSQALTNPGTSASTFGDATTFGFTTAFSIRYVW
jgi:hypothetical protein